MNIEITVRDIKHIQDLIKTIKELQPAQINITDKNGLTDNLVIAETMKGDFGSVHFVPHYSFKNHTNKDQSQIIETFREFVFQAHEQNITEILLVSGSPRPKLDTLGGLKLASEIMEENKITDLKFSVAYNPFLDAADLEEENKRLSAKLEDPNVTRVYLQIGSLVHPFKKGVEFIRTIRPEIPIFSSIVIPSANFLSKFRFRPWKGVVLDEKYLSNVKNATEKTKDLIRLSDDLKINKLIELVGIQHIKVDELRATYGDLI